MKKLEELNRLFKEGKIIEKQYTAEVDKIRQLEENAPVEPPTFEEDEIDSAPVATYHVPAGTAVNSEIALGNVGHEWDVLEQRDQVKHIETVKIGVELVHINKALRVMAKFKELNFSRIYSLIFSPMFETPRRFLFLWKILFLLGEDEETGVDTFVSIVLPSAVDIGLISRKQFERFQAFKKIGPRRAAGYSWNDIGKELAMPPTTVQKIFNESFGKIQAFTLPSAEEEIKIINAAYSALADQELFFALRNDVDPKAQKHFAEIGKEEKARALAEYEAFKKKHDLKY